MTVIVPPAYRDVADVTTSSSRPRVLLAGIGFAMAALCALGADMAIARGLEGIDLPGDLAKLINYSEVFGHGLGVALIILVATTLDSRHGRVGGFLAAHALLPGLLANGIKFLVPRVRPYHCPDLSASVLETFLGWGHLSASAAARLLPAAETASFPSAHSATAAGLALGLSMLYPRGRYWFWMFAALAGLQRMVARAHFTSDVLTGVCLAMIVGCLIPPKSRWRL